ncbi:hypothetical protein [Endozoicomonas euniceicola]|uniref:Uncharacterized protein n=1 Tax=Endozoicomonas euniceicola TaxID=1234143 RepID=A0ABY6GYI6_9GAMM|nr:hypothetical protein [Endozoicomonas euniceicola]UYM17856.1 hypothetical protein NX720_08100 [Endozoicomonas euniceicola]
MCKSNIRSWQGLLKLWTLSFLLLAFIGIVTSQNTHATKVGDTEALGLNLLQSDSGIDNADLARQILEMFQSPITGGELSEYGPIATLLATIVSWGLGGAMSLNLFIISGDWGKAIPAMFGTFFLAAENVFKVLQFGTYRRFFHRHKCAGGACPDGRQWADLIITFTAVGSGVIISVADADSAGTGLATTCKKSDKASNSETNYFNSTQCANFDNGYYEGCILEDADSQTFGNQTFGNQTFGNQTFGNQTFVNQTFVNQTEVANEPYNSCEKARYAAGVVLNGIPTAIVGMTAMHSVLMYIKALLFDIGNAANTMRKGIPGVPFYSATFISEAGKQAMSLKDSVSTVLKEAKLTEPTTYLAQKFRQGFKPEVAYQAIQYAKTQELVTSNALLGAAGGVMQVAVLAGVSLVGIYTLTDVFNSGKNLDYIKRNGFSLIPTEDKRYVVQFPDGTVVDPEHPDYKINKEFVQSFKDNMESADGAMIRSQMTYIAQSIMVGLAGVIGPFLVVKGLGQVIYHSKIRELPMEFLYFPSFAVSLAMTSAGFHFYGENLDGAEESIKQLTAYRKATGEDKYIVDDMLTPNQKIWLSKILLAGVFTVMGAVAIQPYISLSMRKTGNFFVYISHFCKH